MDIRQARGTFNLIRGEHDRGKTTVILRRRSPEAARGRRYTLARRGDHTRPHRPQRDPEQVVRRSVHHQGRCHRLQGDRAARPVREHGSQAGQRRGVQDVRRGRRRHDHGDDPGPRHLSRRAAEHHRRGQPHGDPPRHREGRRGGRRRAHRQDLPARLQEGRDRPGRRDLGQQRPRDRQDAGRRRRAGRPRRRDHRRGGQDRDDHPRVRRGHAVRQGLSEPLLRDQPVDDGGPLRGRADPAPREEDQQPARDDPAAGEGRAVGQAAA